MTDRYRNQWETLGTNDPYWAVLTDPRMKDGRWNKEEFFQTGIDEIDSLLKKIHRLGIQLKFELALDYGCGVGRLSRALSTSFQRVLGVDISEAMLSDGKLIQNIVAVPLVGSIVGALLQFLRDQTVVDGEFVLLDAQNHFTISVEDRPPSTSASSPPLATHSRRRTGWHD